MERTTEKITLPESGAIVEMFSSLSIGEYRQIQGSMLKNMRMTLDPENKEPPKVQDFTGDVLYEQEELVLELLVKSISTKEGVPVEDVKGFLFDLSIIDGNILYDKANEISSNSNLGREAKKK